MKLTKQQKNAIFKAFAERMLLDGHGCSFCKYFTVKGECKQCLSCDQYCNCELTDSETKNWYWAEVEAALNNKVKQTKTKEL